MFVSANRSPAPTPASNLTNSVFRKDMSWATLSELRSIIGLEIFKSLAYPSAKFYVSIKNDGTTAHTHDIPFQTIWFLTYFDNCMLLWGVQWKIWPRNTIFRHARIEIKHAISHFTNTNVLIGQFDLMKSYGYVGIFHCKLIAISIGNFPFATVMRTLHVYIYIFFSWKYFCNILR